MLYHNENDADGIQQVLTALHQYVPYNGDDANRVYSSQGVVADQLSVERGVTHCLSFPMVLPLKSSWRGCIWKLLTGMQETNF